MLEDNEPINNYLVQNLLTKSTFTQLIRKCYACIDLRCLQKLGIGEHPDQFIPDLIFTYYIYILMCTDMYVYMLITSCLCLLAVRLPYQNIICTSCSVFTCYMSHPSHLWFSCPSNVMWRVHLCNSLHHLILSCTQIFYTALFFYTTGLCLVKVIWLWVCLCLDLYYNTHMLTEELILQGGPALQSYVWFITGTNLNIAVYFKYELSMVYLKIIYICLFYTVFTRLSTVCLNIISPSSGYVLAYSGKFIIGLPPYM
jgi:hypothetical protein